MYVNMLSFTCRFMILLCVRMAAKTPSSDKTREEEFLDAVYFSDWFKYLIVYQ